MNDTNTLEYIENYFCHRLSVDEKRSFEKRCEEDEAFSKEVAFYLAAREALKTQLQAEKTEEFAVLYKELSSRSRPKVMIVEFWPYLSAAAACLLLFFAWMFFIKTPDRNQLADAYIQEHMETISVTMGGADSIQLGVNAFNTKNYKLSENIFTLLSTNKDKRTEAVKYLGFIYLTTGKYDLAIQEFDTLSRMRNLYANPGYFYKAIALMKRGAAGDAQEAQKLLEEVVAKKLPGYPEAVKWKELN